tara:strand:+ start:2397 stop:2714 length:318 start_codon:yes stop_codon:yes gene_type:complete
MDLDRRANKQKQFISFIQEANDKAEEIRHKKMQTYNGKNVMYEDYISLNNFYIYQLWNKMLRIISISKGSNNNFESIEDTLLDLINYSKLAYAEQKVKNEYNKSK